MRYIHNLFFWEVRYRINKLKSFQELIENYFAKVEYSELSQEIIDNDNTITKRKEINLGSSEIQSYLDAVISSELTYYPPPAIGGYVTRIGLLDNIFNLQKYDISPQNLIDVLEKATGIYQNELKPALFRIFNPFMWLGKLLEIIASIPFLLLGSIGFNKEKMESSWMGKLAKFGIKFLTITIPIWWDILFRLGIVPERINMPAILNSIF